MSAETMAWGRYTPWQPDPVRQKRADFTIEDVLNLPPDAPRVELVDGVMIVVPSPTEDHQNTCSLLWAWLRAHAPQEFQVVQAVGVVVSVDRTYEPDVLLRRSGGGGSRHFFAAEDVVVAVEVVSRHTRTRDRLGKPAEYAAAGIPFYWRVEQNPVHVYAYRLTAGGSYELAGDSARLLELTEPFPIKLSIADITP